MVLLSVLAMQSTHGRTIATQTDLLSCTWGLAFFLTLPPGSCFSISAPSLSFSVRSATAPSTPLAAASCDAFHRLYSSQSLRQHAEAAPAKLACPAALHDTVARAVQPNAEFEPVANCLLVR